MKSVNSSARNSNLETVSRLQTLLEDGNCRVVDCRFDLMDTAKGREDYLAGHIPGAVFADLDQDLAGPVTARSGRHPLPDAAKFADALGGWGINNDSRIVAYDGGNSALAAHFWWLMRWMGHTDVAVLDGGLAAWLGAGGPLETGSAAVEVEIFQAAPDDSRVADIREILDLVAGDSDSILIDARDRSRYLGEAEPIDPVAGHIPGAINLPLTDSLDESGMWRSLPALRQLWGNKVGDRPDAALIAMCGSGVTACHLVLSAVVAGLPEPRVYVGSWSEWIRDKNRPVARGEG